MLKKLLSCFVALCLLFTSSVYVLANDGDSSSGYGTYAVVPGGGGGETILSTGTYNWAINDNSNISNYNCYGYAIDQKNGSYKPGDFSGIYVTIGPDYISYMMNAVIQDLKTLGYKNVRSVSSSYSPSSSEILIAMRVGYNSSGSNYDFHFMRYNQSNGYSYHKPGSTAVLKYMGNPKTTTWKDEFYNNGKWYINNNITYNSTIKYVVYSL